MHLYRRSFGILGGPASAQDLPVSSSSADEFTATLNPQSLMDSRPVLMRTSATLQLSSEENSVTARSVCFSLVLNERHHCEASATNYN